MLIFGLDCRIEAFVTFDPFKEESPILVSSVGLQDCKAAFLDVLGCARSSKLFLERDRVELADLVETHSKRSLGISSMLISDPASDG